MKTYDLCEAFDGREEEELFMEGISSVEIAVLEAEKAGLEYFVIYPAGSSSYSYCSW